MRKGSGYWNPAAGYVRFLLPPGLLLTLFFLLPLALVVIRSLVEPAFGLTNFRLILTNALYWWVFLRTFQVALSVTVITLIISYPVAWLLVRARGNLLRLCLAIVAIPFWTSVVVRTFAWMVLFQRQGILNDAMMAMGVVERPIQLQGTSLGMHIGMVHIMLPLMILPLFNTLRGIDPVLMRAAAVLGANPFRQFLHILLPLSAPGVAAGCLLVFISALGFYITPALLGGPRDMMVAVLIEQQAIRLLNWPAASALATLLLFSTGLLYFFYEWAASRLKLGLWSSS